MNSNYDNEWSDELEDNEYPDEDDHLNDSCTLPCPHCGEPVYEDSPACPDCGEYITHSASVWDGRPVWWIVLALVGIFAVAIALSIGI